MQYQINPNELWDMAKDRHSEWLRQAEQLRLQQLQPATQPLAARIARLMRSMMFESKQRWLQARTILKLAPVE